MRNVEFYKKKKLVSLKKKGKKEKRIRETNLDFRRRKRHANVICGS